MLNPVPRSAHRPDMHSALSSAAPFPITGRTFDACFAAALAAPLTEAGPEAPADRAAALGFALAWLSGAMDAKGPRVWIVTEAAFSEDGVPFAEGLWQFGVRLDQIILARAPKAKDALCAAEQALGVPGARILCEVGAFGAGLDLAVTRRLLLRAEDRGSACLLLRTPCGGPSAAWTRWGLRAAPMAEKGSGTDHELGPPCALARLTHNRRGPGNLVWRLEWNAHERCFSAENIPGNPRAGENTGHSALDVTMAAFSAHGPVAAQRAGAARAGKAPP